MENKFTAKAEVTINAPRSAVWKALTDPEMIKQYLFGTEVVTDWKEGSPIVYKGTWEGKEYEDKGVVKKVENEKLLVSTYWSSLTGTPDEPENYQVVSYELFDEGSGTKLVITQDNVKSEDDKDHSAQNWQTVLNGLKEIVEK